MKFINIYDTHLHSNNSFDGNDSCAELCKSAIKHGARGIAITDHCDIDGVGEDCWDFEDKQSIAVFDCKKEFGEKLNVYCGTELGQGIYKKELSEKFLSSYDFDFVLGSIHNLENMQDFYFLDYTKFDIDELLNKYFSDLLELAKWNKTDSLAHLTYPLRYIVSREHINVDLSKYQKLIDEIFLTVIKNEKAIELNVSGLSMDMQDTLPNKSLIKRFKELGGKYVTVGSDSHYAAKVCSNIDRGYEILKECGFKHFTVFENRKPKLIEIL